MSEPSIPSYFLRRPAMPGDSATLAAFDALFARALSNGGAAIDYRLAAPKWQFLCHLADTRDVLLHGSGNPAIELFEPRQSNDVSEFGDRKAVYAASDGLWPMYFAMLDRDRFPMSLINSSVRLDLGEGRLGDPYYFFSISKAALAQQPFRRGTIYILPRQGFEHQGASTIGNVKIQSAQWASPDPVKPLAKLSVGAADFPLLAQLRGHDDESTFARARANPDGFPWLDEA